MHEETNYTVILHLFRISYFAWVIQFLIWNLIVAVCKSILFTIELLLNKPLNAVG